MKNTCVHRPTFPFYNELKSINSAKESLDLYHCNRSLLLPPIILLFLVPDWIHFSGLVDSIPFVAFAEFCVNWTSWNPFCRATDRDQLIIVGYCWNFCIYWGPAIQSSLDMLLHPPDIPNSSDLQGHWHSNQKQLLPSFAFPVAFNLAKEQMTIRTRKKTSIR